MRKTVLFAIAAFAAVIATASPPDPSHQVLQRYVNNISVRYEAKTAYNAGWTLPFQNQLDEVYTTQYFQTPQQFGLVCLAEGGVLFGFSSDPAILDDHPAWASNDFYIYPLSSAWNDGMSMMWMINTDLVAASSAPIMDDGSNYFALTGHTSFLDYYARSVIDQHIAAASAYRPCSSCLLDGYWY